MVSTVMLTPWTVSTIHNGTFISLTLNIVQPNLSTSLTKPCTVWSTDNRQLENHFYPNDRHKQFPRYLCNRSPLCPLQAHFLQSVSKLLMYKLEVNSYLGFEKQTNNSIPPSVILSCTQNILKLKTSSSFVICTERLRCCSTKVCKEIGEYCEM